MNDKNCFIDGILYSAQFLEFAFDSGHAIYLLRESVFTKKEFLFGAIAIGNYKYTFGNRRHEIHNYFNNKDLTDQQSDQVTN